MKWLASLSLLCGLAFPAFAQHRTFTGVQIPNTGHRFGFGFGNVVFPGSGGPRLPHFSITDPGFAHRLGGIVTGFQPFTGAPTGHFRRGRTVAVPFAVPVVVGGYYPEPVPQQVPNVIVIAPQQQPAPPVVINQNFAPQPEVRPSGPTPSDNSGVGVYQAPSPSSAEGEPISQEPTIYLIAYKDSSIHAAIAYWVEGDTLHYVTPQGRPNQASLALIDREYSRQLNRGRSADFHLPAGN